MKEDECDQMIGSMAMSPWHVSDYRPSCTAHSLSYNRMSNFADDDAQKEDAKGVDLRQTSNWRGERGQFR